VTQVAQRAGRELREFVQKVGGQVRAARRKLREYRLFAKTKEAKDQLVAQMATVVEGIHRKLGQVLEATRQGARQVKERVQQGARQVQQQVQQALQSGAQGVQGRLQAGRQKWRGYALVARGKVEHLHETMGHLLPQIRYWLRTGRVAVGKIISLHIPQLYSVVRGKVGKAVEFGLIWGFTRLGGGFVLAKRAQDRKELVDARYAVQAAEDVIDRFGVVPTDYSYDRGGFSGDNVTRLVELGIKNVGLAPRGRAQWAVQGAVRRRLIRQRAMVEGGIGTCKSRRYGFNRPACHSTEMMGVCGQRAVLGSNLSRLLRGVGGKNKARRAA
jgi:gas vesicle protein